MIENLYIAVDLGAGSGRVFLGNFGDKFLLEETHRFQYPPKEENGHLRWDFEKIFSEIKIGLKKTSNKVACMVVSVVCEKHAQKLLMAFCSKNDSRLTALTYFCGGSSVKGARSDE